MNGLGYTVAMALLALAPHLGPARAKSYADTVARASIESHVDPWMLVALGRIETGWRPDSLGGCCGGLMSIHWHGWTRYAQHHGLPTDRHSLQHLARDGDVSIRIAADVLVAMRRLCGDHPIAMLGAYQTGHCTANAYGRRAVRMASSYRARWSGFATPAAEPPEPPALTDPLQTQPPTPLAPTVATVATGP